MRIRCACWRGTRPHRRNARHAAGAGQERGDTMAAIGALPWNCCCSQRSGAARSCSSGSPRRSSARWRWWTCASRWAHWCCRRSCGTRDDSLPRPAGSRSPPSAWSTPRCPSCCSHGRPNGRRLVGLAAGMVGVVVLASGDVGGVGIGPAVAAGTAGAFLYGVSANLVKRHFAGLQPAAVAAATLAWGAVLLSPFAVWQWPSAHVSTEAWFSLIALGVVCTGIAYAFYYRLIQRIGAPRATTVTYLVPVFGVLLAWLALGEPLTLGMAVGGALILGGMLMAQGKPRAVAVPHRAALNKTCAECHG